MQNPQGVKVRQWKDLETSTGLKDSSFDEIIMFL